MSLFVVLLSKNFVLKFLYYFLLLLQLALLRYLFDLQHSSVNKPAITRRKTEKFLICGLPVQSFD